MRTVVALSPGNVKRTVRADNEPNQCPHCKKMCTPTLLAALLTAEGFCHLQVIYRCPNVKCYGIFIAIYAVNQSPADNAYCKLLKVEKNQYTEQRSFRSHIKEISPDFCSICLEADIAEENDLKLIAGVGYRKALEYLIKDFLINHLMKERNDEQEKIRHMPLGNCIKIYIEDTRIKNVAERAAWLGNDETHYIRKWEGRNLEDLKRLINMTENWIDLVMDSDEYERGMPG